MSEVIDPPRHSSDSEGVINLSEVLAALSYALDLTEGQPAGHTVRSCVIGMRLGELLALDVEQRSSLFYALLLKDVGCSANSADTADLFGSDDHAVKKNLKTVNWSELRDAATYGLRNAALGRSPLAKVVHSARIAAAGRRGARKLVRTRCERGADISRKLGFPKETANAVRCLDEHWDGAGYPDGLAGDAVPLLSRIALLAQTIDVFVMESDVLTALQVIDDRAGSWFDPDLARVACSLRHDVGWWDGVYGAEVESLAIAAEPAQRMLPLDGAGLDRVAEAFAEVIDTKSPYTFHHSTGVAEYSVQVALQLGCDSAQCQNLYRAGLLHDIGKLAISNRILDKAGKLTSEEFRIVRTHPIHTFDILSHVRAFSSIARVAALHHERLDGTGYPWGVDADGLDRAARILAVADVFEALTANRPYRRPLTSEEALTIMERDAGSHLDAEVLAGLEATVR